eukprot:scaffold1239_cov175-Pinguiococcus_pyrenoidosus.AAC.16
MHQAKEQNAAQVAHELLRDVRPGCSHHQHVEELRSKSGHVEQLRHIRIGSNAAQLPSGSAKRSSTASLASPTVNESTNSAPAFSAAPRCPGRPPAIADLEGRVPSTASGALAIRRR